MGLLFKANKSFQDDEPNKKTTRFKRWHVREKPEAPVDTGIDPHGSLTRMDRCHVREVAEPKPRIAAIEPIRTKTNVEADLHATDPISVDVLRKALPLRSATIAS